MDNHTPLSQADTLMPESMGEITPEEEALESDADLVAACMDRKSAWSIFRRRHQRLSLRERFWSLGLTAAAVVAAVLTTLWAVRLTQPVAEPIHNYTCSSYDSPVSMNLPDGSYARLAPNSTLQMPSNFGTDTRQLNLIGDAYFNVVHRDDNAPFTISHGEHQVRVFGTKFAVATSDESRFVATLIDGSITYTNQKLGCSRRLLPGQQLRCARGAAEPEIVNLGATVDDYLSSEHAFPEEALASILARMGNIYNVQISCANPEEASRKYRAVFYQGESLDYFLRLTSMLTGLNYKREQNNIEFQ